MNTQELELFLQGGTETQRHEIKSSIPWNIKNFARTILALTNVRDGGYVIIGVKDDFTREGVNEEIQNSYKVDEMKDQMFKFADPKVNFEVCTVKDNDGKKFVVIKIFEFEETPVICKRTDENARLQEGIVYFRNTNKRIQSAPISNSNDMKDLIELATSKKMSRWKLLGLSVQSADADKFKEEREDL